MARNIEIKSHLRDKNEVLDALKELTNHPGEIIKQTDTFFGVPKGRLKLRQIEGACSELIFYDRPNTDGPKLSNYEKYEFSENSNLLSVLCQSLDVKGVVKKVRYLYMIDQTRVHIDEVEGLGHFLELEVVLKSGQTSEEGQQIAEDIMAKLGIKNDDLIAGAYMDLLLKK
ncbi:hypothetical protein R5R35_009179 [Gryllus longicercus]|uniref:CYTH domain-containing protein n=1 Tax=Gryllus longicercus TaxID=2509291 RepID=A0AAN9VJJ0_9ORTH